MKHTFKQKLLQDLQTKLGKKNIHEVPFIEKVVVSMGIGSTVAKKGIKEFWEFEKNIAIITGQKPILIKSKKAISNFKLRENMPVMFKVTLRRQKAYDLIDRLVKIVLPRGRDFNGISTRSFDHNANYNLGFPSYQIFPEFGLEDITMPMGLQINIVTNTKIKEDTKALLEHLGMIFQEK